MSGISFDLSLLDMAGLLEKNTGTNHAVAVDAHEIHMWRPKIQELV
jgi:hypothetical protein